MISKCSSINGRTLLGFTVVVLTKIKVILFLTIIVRETVIALMSPRWRQTDRDKSKEKETEIRRRTEKGRERGRAKQTERQTKNRKHGDVHVVK